MTKKERVEGILRLLDEHYGTDLGATLDYAPDKAWQLLFSTILSAQCTDARVNMVTKDLYVKYKDVQAFADADLHELEQDIHSIGFYHSKAKNLIACAKKLISDFEGQVPRTIEELTSLPGVGRKTANVIRGNIYHEKALPEDHWILINLQGITLGREICKAPTPRCGECFLTQYCRYYEQNEKAAKRKQKETE